MGFFGNFNDGIVAFASRFAPIFLKDPTNQLMLVMVTDIVVFAVVMGFLISCMDRIKNTKNRTLLLGVFACLLADVVLYSMAARPLDSVAIGLVLFLNVMFLGIASLPRILKQRPSIWDNNTDLHFTVASAKGRKLAPCPGCGKRTISQFHARRIPQTCGECGRRFTNIQSQLIPNIAATLMVIGVFGIIYMVLKGAISLDQGKLGMGGLAAVYFVTMLQLVKPMLVEVSK